MPDYRAYLVDIQGRVFARQQVDAPDDATAIAAIRHLAASCPADQAERIGRFEIWLGSGRNATVRVPIL